MTIPAKLGQLIIVVSYMDPYSIIMIRILNIVGLMSGTSAAAQPLQDICIHQFAKARFLANLLLENISHFHKISIVVIIFCAFTKQYHGEALNWDNVVKLAICSFRRKVYCLQSSLQGNLSK